MRRQTGNDGDGRLQCVLGHAFRSFRRNHAGHNVIQRGGAGVDIGPGALLAMPVILFPGGVAGSQDRGHSPVPFAERLAGRAKIEQDRATGRRDVDVLRFDVAMQKAFGMDFVQTVEQRQHRVQRGLLGHSTTYLRQMIVKTVALQIVHHQIGGAIFLKEGADPHHVRMIELGQGSGFLQKLLHPVTEMFGVRAGMGADRKPVKMTPGDVPRQIFLDRHEGRQLAVPAQVGDPEPTGFAEDFPDQVLAIHQWCAGRQQQWTLLCVFVKPARGTDAIFQRFLKTSRANHDGGPL